jgi:hypothetical protein
VRYEIDLSEDNAKTMRALLFPYVRAATRVGGRTVRLATGQADGRDDVVKMAVRGRSRLVRAWAAENGYAVSERGRLPMNVLRAFSAASAAQRHTVEKADD